MIGKVAASVALALSLGACVGNQPEEKLPPQPVAQGIELTKEQGGRFIAFVGPRQQFAAPFLDVPGTNFFVLRSWLDNKTGQTAHQLYLEDSYFGVPYRWLAAHGQDNAELRFIPISRNEISCEDGCSYADEFAAALPEDYLRAHPGGFTVTFTAQEGKTLAINVPASLVDEQLSAIDAVRAKIAAAATAPAQAAPASAAPVAAPAQATPPSTTVPSAPPAPPVPAPPAPSPTPPSPAPPSPASR